MLHDAGFPSGTFNLVHCDGPTVGSAMSRHPDIQMMSFTGSTRAGTSVTKDAADTVKRVTLELGGKSPNIVFADCDLEERVSGSVLECFFNTSLFNQIFFKIIIAIERASFNNHIINIIIFANI